MLEAMGQTADAKLAYLRAKDEDICPLRMTEKMHEAVLRVARQSNTPLIDVRAGFEKIAEHGIPGDDELIDHVHPRIPGHKMIAQQLFEFMCEQKWVRPRPNWEATRASLYKQNFVELPDSYFPESQARLEGLQGWAAGRAQKMRLSDR